MASSSTTFGLLTSILVRIQSQMTATFFVQEINTVRNKASWECVKANSSDGPARRTGHTCVTYGDRIFVYVWFFAFSPYASIPLVLHDILLRAR